MSQEQTGQERKDDIILKQDGEPFANPSAAKSAAVTRGLEVDTYDINPYGNGYAIYLRPVDAAPRPRAVTRAQAVVKQPGGGYRRVRFHTAQSPNETPHVELHVNCETVVIQRNKVVVLPNKFIEAARHATYPHFEQLPNQPRKIIGSIMIYPFDDLGEATYDDYIQMKSDGTKKTQEYLEKQGLIEAAAV